MLTSQRECVIRSRTGVRGKIGGTQDVSKRTVLRTIASGPGRYSEQRARRLKHERFRDRTQQQFLHAGSATSAEDDQIDVVV